MIIGAGAAGVFTAYRLREMYGRFYDIVLLEANDRVGGNCYSTTVTYGGRNYSIDCGAQFFYKNPQPSYCALVEQLGLMDEATDVISAPAGFTVWDKQANARRLWLPSRLLGFLHYANTDWDRLAQFAIYMTYSAFLDRETTNWSLSVDDWFSKLVLLDSDFKENVIKPFMYQFVSLPLSRIGESSALYAVTYFVRNVFGDAGVPEGDENPPELPGLPTFQTYQSMIGLDGILRKALSAARVTPTLSSPVTSVARSGDVSIVQTAAGPIQADHVVFACDPHAAATILQAGGTSPTTLLDTLKGLEYVGLPISMQKDGSCWMPSNTDYWEPVSTLVDGSAVRFTAWFGRLRPSYNFGQKIPVFKTWGAPDIDGASCPHQFLPHRHYIPLPTTTFMTLRESLQGFQGKDGHWFAGGWTRWFDSQEAALDSATWVADQLPPTALPFTGRARMVAPDPQKVERNLRRWLERVARHAPENRRDAIAHAIDEVAAKG
ncbi:MAG: NAD(P)-binding protein [Polyangiaceae bacterium]|nr:NAD(P)-binding protein [Polyangiaceae bacterium]